MYSWYVYIAIYTHATICTASKYTTIYTHATRCTASKYTQLSTHMQLDVHSCGCDGTCRSASKYTTIYIHTCNWMYNFNYEVDTT